MELRRSFGSSRTSNHGERAYGRPSGPRGHGRLVLSSGRLFWPLLSAFPPCTMPGILWHQSTTRGHHGERSQHWRRQQNEQGDQQYFEHDLPSHLISGLCARPSPLRSWTLLFAVSQQHGVGKFTTPELSVLP